MRAPHYLCLMGFGMGNNRNLTTEPVLIIRTNHTDPREKVQVCLRVN